MCGSLRRARPPRPSYCAHFAASKHSVPHPLLLAATLVGAREALAGAPGWGCARVADASIQIAYIGCSVLPLGALVQGWSEGWLRVEDQLVFSGGGSPLSGCHSLQGLQDGQRVKLSSPRWTRRGVEVLRAARSWSGESPYGPECVLAKLGAAVPPLRIDAPDGTQLTCWRPDDTALLGEPIDDAQAGQHEEIWQENKRVLASISPVRSGIWRGEVLVTPEGVTAHPGWLEGPTGALLAWLERPLPPRAAAALGRALLRETQT